MSARPISFQPPASKTAPPASQFSKTLTQEGSEATLAARPEILTQEGQLLAVPKWNATSNRNTPELKFPVTHTKQSTGQLLIDTFRAFAAMPAQGRPAPNGFSAARKLENLLTCFRSTTPKFLIDNFHRDLSAALSSHSTLNPTLIECGEEGPAFLIAELWKIRYRCNSLKTNGRRHF